MEDLGPCLPNTDVLFANEAEMQKLTGHVEPGRAAARLRESGVQTVVVKLGASGSAVYTGREEMRVPAFDVAAVDTTGAGDVFAGAFLAALQRRCGLREAARMANAAAGLAVQKLGATACLVEWSELAHWAATAPVRA
jgi:ribokinase